MVSIEDYKKEEELEHITELLGNMFDVSINDLIDIKLHEGSIKATVKEINE